MSARTASPPRATTRHYGGLSPEARRLQREQRLLDAALTLFSRQGYANTSIEQLCISAKVTARHFYERFDGKEGLLIALYHRIVTDLSTTVIQAIEPHPGDIERQVAHAVTALIQHYLTDERLARIGVIEVVGVSPAMERERRIALTAMARVIDGYFGLMLTEPVTPRQRERTAMALVGGINELMADWLTRSDRSSLDDLADDLMHIVLALVRGLSQSTPAHLPPLAGATS